MGYLEELKTVCQIAFKPIKGETHKQRLESFYSGQAQSYDSFRKKLLWGRQSLADKLEFHHGEVWVDVGGGTGANLDFLSEKIKTLKAFYIVDLSPSLLLEAKKKAERMGLTNVHIIEADATEFELPAPADGIIFSYSLTMIPDWFLAIDRAKTILAPGGKLAVVDFYVSRKFTEETDSHGWWTRHFWPFWFSHDNVNLSPEHVPYLMSHFKKQVFESAASRVPYVPLGKVPYYQFIGIK